MSSSTKANRTRNLRYKRPALASMSFDTMESELDEIIGACENIHWFIDQDDDTLINALDGDEEQAWEFKIAFADLEAKGYELREAMNENWSGPESLSQRYNYCTVALIGDRYQIIGWDGDEEDYMSLTRYEKELAWSEAGTWLMRLTKKEMISTIGQCFGTLIAFLDLRQSYDYLKATFDILRDENTSLLQQIKEIEAAYEAVIDRPRCDSWSKEVQRFDLLLEAMPDRAWIE